MERKPFQKLERTYYMSKEIKIEQIKNHLFYVWCYDISSNLLSITYDTRNTALIIVFKSNTKVIYDYLGVSMKTFLEMLASESLGKYFCKNIKNKYLCLKQNENGTLEKVK